MTSATRLKVLVAVVLAGLVAALLGALVLAGSAGDSAGPSGTVAPDGRTPSTPPTATTDPTQAPAGEREALLTLTEQAVEALLSYDHATFGDDVDEAARWTTRAFGQQLGGTLRGLQSGVEEVEGVVTSETVASGVVELTENGATVLVFVDQTSVTRDTTEPQVVPTRLLVQLARVDGGWAVDGIDGEGGTRVTERAPERRRALTVASDFVGAFTSVDPDPEQHLRTLRPFLARDYLDQMREQLRGAGDRRRSRGRVIAAGLARLDRTAATVLVSADARRPGGDTQSYRLLIDLVRERGGWKVAEMRLV